MLHGSAGMQVVKILLRGNASPEDQSWSDAGAVSLSLGGVREDITRAEFIVSDLPDTSTGSGE